LRGIEAVFQLEEGEILAEPMPARDARNGFLLYEATEGGAGVLTRLVAEPKTVAQVALEALAIMHFDVSDSAILPDDPSALADVASTSCVAACYRCLMSYYNQPDHELIDRRDSDARALLLRLARSTTSLRDAPPVSRRSARPGPAPADATLARWLEQARARELPMPDSEPLAAVDLQVPLVWRAHYVAVLFDDPATEVRAALEDKGFEVLVFRSSEPDWSDSFARLATALGRGS
jgi:hypothetical protein